MEKKYADINTLSRFLYNLKNTFSLLTHTHTKAEIGLGNVDNKSSATIRGEITTANVVNALGYTPLNENDVIDPTTATVDGFAADAKLTGDAISELNKNIDFYVEGAYVQGTSSWINGERCIYMMTHNSLKLSGMIVSQVASNQFILSGLPDLSKYEITEFKDIVFVTSSGVGNTFYYASITKNDNSSIKFVLQVNLPVRSSVILKTDIKLKPKS